MIELRNYKHKQSLECASVCTMDYQKGIEKCGKKRKAWIRKMMKKGLDGFVAYSGNVPAGFFEYAPIEVAPDRVNGSNLTFIVCGLVHIWNNPQRKRYTGKGIGRMLIEHIEQEAKKKSRGVVAWGYDWDNWFMPASFFKHLGYKQVAKDGKRLLLWKVFKRGTRKPKLIKKKFNFKPSKDKIAIDILSSEQCPFFIGLLEKWKNVVKRMGKKYILRIHKLKENKDFCKFGSGMAIVVQGKSVSLGPMSDEYIEDILRKEGK